MAGGIRSATPAVPRVPVQDAIPAAWRTQASPLAILALPMVLGTPLAGRALPRQGAGPIQPEPLVSGVVMVGEAGGVVGTVGIVATVGAGVGAGAGVGGGGGGHGWHRGWGGGAGWGGGGGWGWGFGWPYWGFGWGYGWDPWFYDPYWYIPAPAYYYPDYGPDDDWSDNPPYRPDSSHDSDIQGSYRNLPSSTYANVS